MRRHRFTTHVLLSGAAMALLALIALFPSRSSAIGQMRPLQAGAPQITPAVATQNGAPGATIAYNFTLRAIC